MFSLSAEGISTINACFAHSKYTKGKMIDEISKYRVIFPEKLLQSLNSFACDYVTKWPVKCYLVV